MVRSQALLPGFPNPMSLPDCQRLHAWAMRPNRQMELWGWWEALQDTTWEPMSLPCSGCVDLVVDGSCFFPECAPLRLASWAVTCARRDLSVPPRILHAGLLPGVLQTSFRAEVFAVLAACRFASLSGVQVRVWCDCLGVVRRCRGLLRAPGK